MKGAVYSADVTRTLEVFIIPGGNQDAKLPGPVLEQYEENMYIPQTLAAYYGVPFIQANGRYGFDLSNRITWRILSQKSVEDTRGVLFRSYQIEAKGYGGTAEPGTLYTCTINIDDPAARQKQPALVALETCAKTSGMAEGFARLDFLRYDSSSKQFTAGVVISGK